MTRFRWTPEDTRRLLEAAAEFGPDRQYLSAILRIPKVTLDNAVNRLCRQEYQAAVESYWAKQRALRELAPTGISAPTPVSAPGAVLGPIAPFEVPLLAGLGAVEGAAFGAVVYGDLQIPFHDPAVVGCVLEVAQALQPNLLLNVGDLLDCWEISDFDKDPHRFEGLQDDIDLARVHLHQAGQAAPTARRVWLCGNHENRLRKAIWRTQGVAREMMRLDVVKEALTWQKLMRLAEIGWEYIEPEQQSHAELIPKVVTKHGTVVRKWSGWTAKAEWERYGRATLSGHTHRLGAFFHRDHNGVIQSWESGCCCSLSQQYGSDFDWQQGFLVVTQSADQAILAVEPVSVRDGRCLWRGKVYRG